MMKTLKPQSIEAAPDGSKEGLGSIQKRFGFIPNLMATFANSPAVLNGYMSLDAAWENSSLTLQERQVVLLTASVENKCRYCVAAHVTGLKAMGLDAGAIAAICNRSSLTDSKQNALVAITRELVSERGFVSETSKKAFFETGYDVIALMEVLAGVGLKTMSNYLDHLSPISIDPAFQAGVQP
jgi:AhpD family alkylhydroperoxidase